MQRAYEEIIDFIAAGTSPDDLARFRPSQKAKERLSQLIHREKTDGLEAEEADELAHYLQLEHMMRLVKARAQRHLAHEQ